MPKYRTTLPQLEGDLFITDGGLETVMYFQRGFDLPEFAAFDLLKNEEGKSALRDYYRTYAELARNCGTHFVLESATWRANPGWGRKIGYSEESLIEKNREAIELLCEIRDEYEADGTRMVISGQLGSRGDGYAPEELMTAEEAEQFHSFQIKALAETEADLVSAFTIPYTEEAIGITRAAQKAGMPVVISFTVETDGRLPSSQPLREAIEQVDAATGNGPAYYMINCAHPTHFADTLAEDESWVKRIRGIRANASTKSHAELEAMEELDAGDPKDFGQRYRSLKQRFGHINIMGGCCGTDHRHIEEMCKAVLPR